MELSFLSSSRFSPHTSTSTSTSPTCTGCNSNISSRPRYFKTRASVERSSSGERVTAASTRSHSESRIQRGLVADGPTMGVSSGQVSAIDASLGGTETDFPVWEKLGAIVRLSYGIGIYGAMAFAGKFICSMSGVDCTGGFHPSLNAIVEGLGYAAPPIMALLFILDDEVVKYSPHARAIRDVEDEELRSFFYGMSPWQFILIVTASSIGEELFYRAAVQGSLSDMFLRGTELMKDARGIATLTGMLPLFVPFAQAFAAVVTAALTGSLYYIATVPKDPTYVVTPIPKSPSSRENYKKLFTAWYQRRQMRKIYSPLLEGLLALYLGFEWIQTDNILAPMITHGIYSAVVLGHGLMKIHEHRRKLRHRIQKIRTEIKD
ncbi:CAAX protease self-immunity protein [Rhynchospora pubera]|uniref:CAAX protease self-immunity protein n=1 Tax=Rhynchospora pubera TaxID=906938 RepID=A0AAV8EUL7_9POAL|nr:CAAX protease self-immunity protein [Rhynchospora pubera]